MYQRLPIRESEILRVQVTLSGMQADNLIQRARRTSLDWASRRTAGDLPQQAWRYETFDHLAVGRNCSAIRLIDGNEDIWAVRSEDPDKNVADRGWTTEITVSKAPENCIFNLRLLNSSRELRPDIEPAVPSVVKTLLSQLTMHSGIDQLAPRHWLIASDDDANELVSRLLSPERRLPTIVLSVSGWSPNETTPLILPSSLVSPLLGLATVVVLPAQYTWVLTKQLGKALSVYEGAARIYLPGFTVDADPFEGHDLILASRLRNPGEVSTALRRLRWAAASYSLRSSPVAKSIRAFKALRSMQTILRQTALAEAGATDREQLDAAKAGIEAFRQELQEATEQCQWLSDEHNEAELRAVQAEEQNGKLRFRIQQLSAQLRDAGETPDAKIELPNDWNLFEEWCTDNLAGRVLLAPQAGRALSSASYNNPRQTAQCLLWLANDYRDRRIEGGEGTLRDAQVVEGVRNSPCGSDSYSILWQGQKREVEWHIKINSNTRDPVRCLRIYYFWDDGLQQVVVTHLPGHRESDAS